MHQYSAHLTNKIKNGALSENATH